MSYLRINAVLWFLLPALLGAPHEPNAQGAQSRADTPSAPPAKQDSIDKLNADIGKLKGRKGELERGRSNCPEGNGACRDQHDRDISKINGQLYKKYKARIDARDDRTAEQKRNAWIKITKKQIKEIEKPNAKPPNAKNGMRKRSPNSRASLWKSMNGGRKIRKIKIGICPTPRPITTAPSGRAELPTSSNTRRGVDPSELIASPSLTTGIDQHSAESAVPCATASPGRHGIP